MDGALRALQHEFISEGKPREFEILKPWLGGEAMEMTQAQAASALGVSEGAVKVMVHRLRKRFRELVRKELAETVAFGSEIDDELRYLVEVLAQA
jgi:RNA polymerase sigma-70 factor (ECF subfamily)